MVSSCFTSRLTSLYGLLTGMHSVTPGIDSTVAISTVPVFPVMPIAVRPEPGIGCALYPSDSMRSQTARICSSVAWDCITTNMEAPCAKSNPAVYCIEEASCKRQRDLRAEYTRRGRLASGEGTCQNLLTAVPAAVQSSNENEVRRLHSGAFLPDEVHLL